MSRVVEVRVIEDPSRNRMGNYFRGDRLWAPGWHQHSVDDDILALIKADPWMEVRELAPHTEAARKMQFANESDAHARTAEATAAELRARADDLMAEAKAAVEAASALPLPDPPEPEPTPFADAIAAATPGSSARKEAEPLAMAASQAAAQMAGTPVKESAPTPTMPADIPPTETEQTAPNQTEVMPKKRR